MMSVLGRYRDFADENLAPLRAKPRDGYALDIRRASGLSAFEQLVVGRAAESDG